MRSHKDPLSNHSALLIDPSVVGQSHLLVNSGIVRLAVARYKCVTIIAETAHCDALKQYLSAEISDQVTFVPWRYRPEIRRTVRNFISGKKFDQIIFTNIEYDIFAYMLLFHRRASRKPILWMVHSHLVNVGTLKKATRIKNFIKRYFLFRLFRRVKFVVLGERIRANVEALIGPFFQRGNITAIIHPVGIARLPKGSSGAHNASKLPRVIFMSGWHALSPKNQEFLSELGHIPLESRYFEVEVISNRFKGANDQKSFSMEYANRLGQISEADFFLHLPNDSYRLQASGAIMDMLLTSTPIIGLRTDFGDELTEIIGPFGYFFDNQDDLLRFFSSAKPDPAEILRFQTNLAAGYEKVVALSQVQFDAVIAS